MAFFDFLNDFNAEKKAVGNAWHFLTKPQDNKAIITNFAKKRLNTDVGRNLIKTRDLAVSAGRGVLKSGARTGVSIAQATGLSQGLDELPVTNPAARIVLGKEPIKSYQKGYKETRDKGVAAPLAFLGSVVSAGLDVTPGGGGKKAFEKEFLETLAKTSTINEVKKVLGKQFTPDIVEKVAGSIARTKDRNIITNILNKASSPSPSAAVDVVTPSVRGGVNPAGKGTLPTDTRPALTPGRTTDVVLNTERLRLSPEQKANIQNVTAETVPTLTNKQVVNYAKSMGIDTKQYTVDQTKKVIAQQLNARKQLVSLENEAEQLRQAGAPVDQIAAVLEKSAEIAKASRTQGTNVARQLQARKIIANELATPQQRIFQLLDNAGVDSKAVAKQFANVDFKDGNQVVAAYRALVPPDGEEWIDLVRYNSMLSSPLTQLVNISSTASNIAFSPIERALTENLDKLRPLFGKERQYVSGEAGAYTKGLTQSFPDAVKKFKDTFMGKAVNPNIEFGGKAMIPVRAVGDNVGVDILSFPQRLLGAFDAFHQSLVRGGSMKALEKRAKEGIDVVNPEILATKEGAYRAFNQQLGNKEQGYVLKGIDELTNSVMKLRNSKNPVVRWPAKLTAPFVRIGSNLFKQGLEYSPAGIITIPGADEITPQISKAIMGTAIFGAAGALIGHNRLTWGEPTSPTEKAAWKAAGKQPYSIKIGDKWIGFAKLPPIISFNLALAAGIDDAVKSSRLNSSGVDNVMEAVAKLGQFYSDQTYLKNVGDFMGAVRGDTEKVAQLVGNYPQQLIPFRALSSWFARMSDDTLRKINSDATFAEKQVQNLMQQIPGLRQKTPERLGPDGEPIKTSNNILNAFSPASVSNENKKYTYLNAFYEARKRAPSRTSYANDIKAALKAGDKQKAIALAREYNDKYSSVFDDWRQRYGAQYGQDEEIFKKFKSSLITGNSLSRWYADIVESQ